MAVQGVCVRHKIGVGLPVGTSGITHRVVFCEGVPPAWLWERVYVDVWGGGGGAGDLDGGIFATCGNPKLQTQNSKCPERTLSPRILTANPPTQKKPCSMPDTRRNIATPNGGHLAYVGARPLGAVLLPITRPLPRDFPFLTSIGDVATLQSTRGWTPVGVWMPVPQAEHCTGTDTPLSPTEPHPAPPPPHVINTL